MTVPAVRLPVGSTILVTGVTGLIGGAIANELLQRDYKVIGVTRSTKKATPLAEKFSKQYGQDAFKIVEFESLNTLEDWQRALEGVDGVVHCSTDNSMSNDLARVVESTKTTTVNLMKAASASERVKAVVLTSSRIAVYHVEYGKDIHVSNDQFADFFYDLAKQTSDEDALKGVMVYAASKTIAEKAAWEHFRSGKQHYSFNTVLPDLTFGPVVHPTPSAWSSVAVLQQLFDAQEGPLIIEGVANPAGYMSDVRDVALIHAAALLAPDVDGQRLWAINHQYHLNDVLKVWREAFPHLADRWKKDYDFPQPPRQIVDRSRSTELLQRFGGRSWISFEQTMLDSVKSE